MPHYPYLLRIDRLTMMADIGLYAQEKGVPQPVEFSLCLYFTALPDYARDDDGAFYDVYAMCAQLRELTASRRFQFIEHLGASAFTLLRGWLDAQGGPPVCLWLSARKLRPPVPGLEGGAAFIQSDLPAGATTAAVGP